MGRYLITGASRGIGRALVIQLTNEGHDVLALARSESSLKTLKEETGCSILTFDLAQPNWKDLEDWIESEGTLDGLIHNAGFLRSKSFTELTDRDILDHYQINVLSAFGLIRSVLKNLSKQGHVVSISSIGGMTGSSKFPGLAAYSSSKAALSTLTECLQAEYSSTDWSFNSLALGAVQTEMLAEAFPDYAAPVTPDEIAPFICNFLLYGNQAIKGKVIPVSLSNP